jgi:rubrerythrin
MVMDSIKSDVLAVIKDAIRLEINGRHFFEHAHEMTQSPLGKKMFKKLANDEIQHLKIFGELFSQILGHDDWKKFVSQEQQESSPIIEELKERVNNSQREKGSGELEAIRIGMELERKAIDFFDQSAREVSDPKAGQICRKIREEEEYHYDLLQAQFDSVNNSGFWLDVAEFQMDGKY